MSGDINEETISYNLNFFIMDTMRRMRDAEAEGDTKKYWVYFKTAFRKLLPFIPMEERVKIEARYRELELKIEEIKASKENEVSRDKQINALRAAFADSHEYYINLGLPKTGIIKVAEDGTIDLTEDSIEMITKIVRAGKGAPTAIRENLPKEEALDERV